MATGILFGQALFSIVAPAARTTSFWASECVHSGGHLQSQPGEFVHWVTGTGSANRGQIIGGPDAQFPLDGRQRGPRTTRTHVQSIEVTGSEDKSRVRLS
ncbi:unnamed protein product [Protopolystoma xenopodis]|uniref:Secreted protein n=1 Tax=Protopolystoma xenopodis TaxID=117903 RepID=A0A448WHY4_9PLAT|nr:unnamed protein product [Protopolystoma xenopodis]